MQFPDDPLRISKMEILKGMFRMHVIEAIKTRKSIRGFKPDPVARSVLRDLLEISTRAPSAMNTQPWEFTVITGDVLENIREENVNMFRAGETPKPEHPVIKWPQESIYRRHQVEIAMQLFELMDIAREDTSKRAQWVERGFCYFDAPAVIILSVDRQLTEPGPLFDMGVLAQTLCLAAVAFGLGTCIEYQGVFYPDTIRKYAKIPESKRIVTSIAIGYPDWDFPANKVESTREPIDHITVWCGFK
jgi:nitroreductase